MTKKEYPKFRLAIFASGSGSNAEAFMQKFKHHPSIEVALIVTNNKEAGVLERAEKFRIENLVIKNEHLNSEKMVLAPLLKKQIDWVVLAGWLRLIPKFMIDAYPNKIINIHPALLPQFGGQGMYGKRVHKAVFDAHALESGISIHFVNQKFDDGKIIAQFSTKLDSNDTPATIEEKVRALELIHYPSTVENVVLMT